MNTLEEKFFEMAAQEISERRTKTGLMAKAFSEADGEEKKAAASYLKLRVDQLLHEHNAVTAEREAQEKLLLVKAAEDAQKAIMTTLGITHNGRYFECGEMHFDQLNEAVSYATELRRHGNA
jgi:hypothetical protein